MPNAMRSLAKAAKISLRDVAAERLIAYSKEDYPEYHAWLEKLFRKQKSAPLLCEEHDSSTSLIAPSRLVAALLWCNRGSNACPDRASRSSP